MKLTELSTFFDDEKNRPNDKSFPSNYKGTFKKYIDCHKNYDVELIDVYTKFNEFDTFIQFLHQTLAPSTVRNYLRCFKSTIGTNIITQEVGDAVGEFEKYIDAKCKEADKLVNTARKTKTTINVVVHDSPPLEDVTNEVESVSDDSVVSENILDIDEEKDEDDDEVYNFNNAHRKLSNANLTSNELKIVNNTKTLKLLEHFQMECVKLTAMIECKDNEIAFLRRVILDKH